jgi:hypothetical protein
MDALSRSKENLPGAYCLRKASIDKRKNLPHYIVDIDFQLPWKKNVEEIIPGRFSLIRWYSGRRCRVIHKLFVTRNSRQAGLSPADLCLQAREAAAGHVVQKKRDKPGLGIIFVHNRFSNNAALIKFAPRRLNRGCQIFTRKPSPY